MSRWMVVAAAAAALAGCKTHANTRFCDGETACTSPAFPYCDIAKNECEATSQNDMAVQLDLLPAAVVDMAVADLTVVPDGGVDANLVDLQPPPACLTFAGCTNPTLPICDPTLLVCRPCASTADNAQCNSHTQGTLCKLSNKNAGSCEQCNVPADCAAATPVCGADGTCVKCTSHSQCASGVCDLTSAPTNGTCVDPSAIVYVNYVNDPGMSTCTETTKNGSATNPFCQISSALIAVEGLPTLKYIHVAPGNQYTQIGVTPGVSGTIAVTIVGPGRCNATPCDPAVYASIVAPGGNNAISMNPGANQSITLTLDGMDVKGSNFVAVSCNLGSASASVALSFVNSSIHDSGDTGIASEGCALRVDRSLIYNNKVGIALVSGSGINSTFSISNSFIVQNTNLGVQFNNAVPASPGNGFLFNTVASNRAGNTNNASGIDCNNSPGNVIIEGSIVAMNGHDNSSGPGTQFGTAGKCELINTVTGADNIMGALSGTPSFVNTGTGPSPAPDYHLNITPASSALTANQGCCIDKISTTVDGGTTMLPTVDVDNQSRPINTKWDVGADEVL